MAGTFNSKNGQLSVTGLTIGSDVINEAWVTAIAEKTFKDTNVDSDVIYRIAADAFADQNIDSEIIGNIAQATQAALSTDVATLQNDTAYLQGRAVGHDSDVQLLKSKYSTVLTNDQVQSAQIATLVADLAAAVDRLNLNDSDVLEVKANVTQLYGLASALAAADTTFESRIDSLETIVGDASSGHEQRLDRLENNEAIIAAALAALGQDVTVDAGWLV